MSTSSQSTFKRQHLPEVLRYIASGQTQGRLVIVHQTAEALIYFNAGQILAARAGAFPGLEAVREVLTWDSGHFEFFPEPVMLSSLPKVIWINMPLSAVMLEAQSKKDDFLDLANLIAPTNALVQAKHGSLNVNSIPRLNQQNGGMQVQIDPATFQLFGYLNGTYRVGHILQATGMTLNTLQSLLQPLLTSGFLELLDFPIAAQETKPQPAIVASKPIPAALIDELEQVLKKMIGPFGTVLLEDAADHIGVDMDAITSKNVAAWLNALTDSIPSERKQAFAAQLVVLRTKHLT